MNPDLTPTMQEYLAEIYRLCERQEQPGAFISTSELASVLDVSATAVNRMVTRLKEMGLVQHQRYHGVRLTSEGNRTALKHLRRHRIAESFLVNVMGLEWHGVYEEAQRMNSALSENLVARMDEMADNPTRCPHGEPIPLPDGTLPPQNDDLLSNAEQGAHLEITCIRTRESDRMEYIAALELTPGTPCEVLHVAPFNGPIQLKVGDEYRIIGHNLAELIRAKPLT